MLFSNSKSLWYMSMFLSSLALLLSSAYSSFGIVIVSIINTSPNTYFNVLPAEGVPAIRAISRILFSAIAGGRIRTSEGTKPQDLSDRTILFFFRRGFMVKPKGFTMPRTLVGARFLFFPRKEKRSLESCAFDRFATPANSLIANIIAC